MSATVTEEEAVQLVIDRLGGVVVEPSRPQAHPQAVEASRTIALKTTTRDDPRGKRRAPAPPPVADIPAKTIPPDVSPTAAWEPWCGRQRPGIDRTTGQPYGPPVPPWAWAMYDRER